MVITMESDLIEIFIDEDGNLYLYNPITSQSFLLKEEEIEELPSRRLRLIVQINLDDLKENFEEYDFNHTEGFRKAIEKAVESGLH